MKRLVVLLSIFSLLKLNAQTADEVIQKYSNAMGGLDKFKALTSLKMSGLVTAQGNDLPLTVQILNGKGVRTDVEVMGQKIISSYKDGAGWKINPFAGATTAVDLAGTELTDLKNQSMIANQLMDYKARGCTAELQGQEDVNGAKAYKVKLTADDKRVYTYYIDVSTSTLIKSVSHTNMQGQDTEVETYYGDVKDFGGLKFSSSRTQKANGTVFQEVHFDKIEVNVPIDEKIFDKE